MNKKLLTKVLASATLLSTVPAIAQAVKDAPAVKGHLPHTVESIREMERKNPEEATRMREENEAAAARRSQGANRAAGALPVSERAAKSINVPTKSGLAGSEAAKVGLPTARQNAPQVELQKLRADIAGSLGSAEVSMRSDGAAGTDHLNINKLREDGVKVMSQAQGVLKSLGFNTESIKDINSKLGNDLQKWNYFLAVVSKFDATQLREFNLNAKAAETDAVGYRDALLNVAKNFGELPIEGISLAAKDGAARADAFADIIKTYDVKTLQTLTNLRGDSAKGLLRTIDSVKAAESGKAAITTLQTFLTDNQVANAAQIMGNFKALVTRVHGENATPAQVADLLRHDTSPEAIEARNAAFGANVWLKIADADGNGKVSSEEAAKAPITHEQVKDLEGCGLKA
ncbi:MAG TPA: hypothetical protein VM901_01045 [Bdellovibrionota bacterium]|nr:hypothetical protein [Bdellovibrionota bacterium]